MILPSAGVRNTETQREGADGPCSSAAVGQEEIGVIYICKFPGCTRQYASTDGALRGT